MGLCVGVKADTLFIPYREPTRVLVLSFLSFLLAFASCVDLEEVFLGCRIPSCPPLVSE